MDLLTHGGVRWNGRTVQKIPEAGARPHPHPVFRNKRKQGGSRS